MQKKDWDELFDNWGIKKVGKTDSTKGYYVPNREQKKAIISAGVTLEINDSKTYPPFNLNILNDQSTDTLEANYYGTQRSEEAKRAVEPRMGRAFATSWYSMGDKVLIGNIGTELYALKIKTTEIDEEALISGLTDKSLLDKAHRKKGQKVVVSKVQRTEFKRDLSIVKAALIRANGRCESPDCSTLLFKKKDGSFYLEVHHLVPLSKSGADSLTNVAALCPNCHRELHHGENAEEKTKLIQAIIEDKEKSFTSNNRY